MQHIDNIRNFAFYMYQKQSKYVCIKRILAIWIVFGLFNYICKLSGWHLGLLFGCFSVVSVILLVSRYKYKDKMWAQFLGDGIFYYGISVFINYVVYIMMRFQKEHTIALFFLLYIILHIPMVLFFLAVRRNIRRNMYASDPEPKNLGWITTTFGFLGIVTARVFLSSAGNDVVYLVIEYGLLLISYAVGCGSLSIYRAYLCYFYLNKQ